jgi:hypothetical protein
LKVQTAEMGPLDLYLIYQYGAEYEPTWRPLQGNPLTTLFTVVPETTMAHALKGFSRPLVQSLGLPPAGCLRKVPNACRECAHREECQFYDAASCFPAAKKLPNCYQPSGVEPLSAQLGHEVVFYWREGTYIVVVTHE